MFGIHDYSLFIVTSILLNLTPGPDTMYILGRSLAQGPRSGVASALGISTGCLVHTIAAALGLSAVLMTSSSAFFVIKMLGAAYLIFLGIQMLRSPSVLPETRVAEDSLNYFKIFRQGVVTNVLNPKVALFFLALLPQFVSKDSPHPALALLTLGLTFIFTGTVWCLCLAFFAGFLSDRIRRSSRLSRWITSLAGLTFLGLGLKLAVSERT
ncbi:LysE family translocator [Oligoflexus tunisiensis]|uniref:LysE family translocator n=1 Tax=Oligoflexus tunisiensis TaxID=708132 RepID=UPI00114D1476|nr:LysE family translocator [Oligoflexus tunisiensis]